MLRKSWRRLAAAADASSSSSSSSSSAPSKTSYPGQPLTDTLHKWCLDQGVRITNVEFRFAPHNTAARGLIATGFHRQGTTLVSAPLKSFGINASKLNASDFVKESKLPKRTVFREELLNTGIRDPVIVDQMYFAFNLAVERLNPKSELMAYLNALPFPAINDETLLQMHQEVLTDAERYQYQCLREDYIAIMKHILQLWQCPIPERKPNIAIVDWAWRTILSRQHLLPDQGAPPPSNKLGFVSWYLMNEDKGIFSRLKDRWTGAVPKEAKLDYELIPTLVPLIDSLDHSPSPNVTVDVADRGSFGPCVEIQALEDIKPGEELGLTFSRANSLAFTLYRFGFLPQ